MGYLRAAPSFIAVLLCTACAGVGAGPLLCTEMGAEPGISVTVAENMAQSAEAAMLEVCDDGCRTYELELRPGSETVDLGCDSSEPEGSCSGEVRPNGTLVGFVVIEQLPDHELEVAILAGGKRYSALGTPKPVYPNGPDCPGSALQLSITLDNGALTA